MLKRIIAFVMMLSVFTVHADSTAQSGLKAAYDDLNYALTVEWDQQDKEFHNKEMRKFSEAVQKLQTKGLTYRQMIDFAKSEIKDAKVAKDLETALTMIQINKMSAKEANKYIVETMKKTYSSGASWGGEVVGILVVSALVLGLAIALANSSSYNGGGYYGGGYNCYYQDYEYCYDTCYAYDWYGYCYSWGYECYWDTRYVCY